MRVAVDAVRCAPEQSFCDGGCCGEIHVGNPHRQDIRVGVGIPFMRIGVSAADLPVEIEFVRLIHHIC